MPASELQTLLIEDNPGDARLVQEYLADAGTIRVNLTHVERLNDGDAWPVEKALAYIREQADQHFDPDVVEMFLEAEHDARP